tara:strand:+ start:819 stop:1103 length:285 start_codon:yes stop_codon:yes gene_type:complete
MNIAMAFMTERETEELLETETRMLPMPDGTTEPYRGFRIMWDTLDYIVEEYDIQLEWLVKLALSDVEQNSVSFQRAFKNIVAYVCHEYDKATGK